MHNVFVAVIPAGSDRRTVAGEFLHFKKA